MKTVLVVSLFLCTSAQADTYIFHCPLGCPESPDGNRLLIKEALALSNDPETKFADWVAYVVDVRNFGESPGREWSADPLLNPDNTLEPKPDSEDDYRGARAAIDTDRGHQAPLASLAGHMFWHQTNEFSNITPQRRALNQGPWKDLEIAVRLGSRYGDPLYVLTGPLYESDEEPMPNAEPHIVPSGYWKIVYDQDGDATGFIMDQELAGGADYCDQGATLTSIATRSELSMPNLDAEASIRARLGC